MVRLKKFSLPKCWAFSGSSKLISQFEKNPRIYLLLSLYPQPTTTAREKKKERKPTQISKKRYYCRKALISIITDTTNKCNK
jgi:hypothetical protein